jgi:signal transduction histidine kinase/CheY-like chemotaxis protein
MSGELLSRRTSRLTWLYIAALSAVATLSITGQVLVQRSLQRQHGDSTVVNIAGRQRMLSQRLVKGSHAGLQRGDRELQLSPRPSAVVAAQFAELEPVFQEMVVVAERFTSAPENERSELLDRLIAAEPKFLAGMDAIVFQLDREAQAKVATLQRIEQALLAATLVVLVIEGWFVFRPAVQNVRAAAAALVESEEQLRIAKEAAESANEQKTRFLATLSHELRNPLHAILGNLELVSETPLDDGQRERIVAIDSSSRTLLGLVNDLLDLACIQAGKLRVKAVPCDLAALARRCVSMVQPLAEQKGLRIELKLAAEPLPVTADPLRVQQIVLNLLGNAVKFTSQGLIAVRICRLSTSHQVRLEVMDTGPGIPPDKQQAIFAAFTQLDGPARREHSGVGLGLAICAGLVDLLQGRMGVDSEPGRGSCFWVELPGGEIAAVGEDSGTSHPPAAAPLRVLVAEDDPVNRRLLADFLQVLGHEAVLAEDGQVAFKQFQQQQADCVLLDWHMPQLDGMELAKAIRSWEQSRGQLRVPLIAVSAAGAIADTDEARAVGVDQVLTKPLSLEHLRHALQGVAPSGAGPKSKPAPDRFAGALARIHGNRELFRDVAVIFLEELPAELNRLQALLAGRQFSELARAAHRLRGQAMNFDADTLARATSDLEDSALAQNAAGCVSALLEVNSASAELQNDLRAVVEA